MKLFPAFDVFESLYKKGQNQVVYTRIAADLETPVSLMLKLTQARKDSFLLESVTGREIRGRYSVIGMKPDLIWKCSGDVVRVNRNALGDSGADAGDFVVDKSPPLASLNTLINNSQIELPDGLPPMAAGLFGYLGYDMIRHVEHLPDINPDPLGLPDAVMMRPSVVLVIDGVKDEIALVAPVWGDRTLASAGEGAGIGAPDAKTAYEQATARITACLRDLENPLPAHSFLNVDTEGSRAGAGADDATPPESNMTREQYHHAVEKAKDYIRAGDIFQVVPSQRWKSDYQMPPFALYRALRRTNPSPYMFYFNFGGFQVIGASPEILVRRVGQEITIRPIAGTRPRGATEAEDIALEADLLADAKECAEHLMLLDLGRNDVGRIAQIGSVKPTERFTIERYSHVMHIVSNVVGQLRDGETALNALLAGLPAGTVSGAPKIRAMQIIDELEAEKRGVYGGGVGYFSANGDMDICIALRTAVVKDAVLYVQAGGGVVHDSDPEAEYIETVNKSKALHQAAREAYLFAHGNYE